MERARILVAGLLNVETSVRVDGFPVPYLPVDYPVDAVKTAASGVALNLACALAALGDVPRVLSPVAGDEPSLLVRQALAGAGVVRIVPQSHRRPPLRQTRPILWSKHITAAARRA